MTFEWELATKYREGIEKGIEKGIEQGKLSLIEDLLKKSSVDELLSLGISKEDIERASRPSNNIVE